MTPLLSVVVPTRDRPLRLRWLLNALEAQTLTPERWEVIVSHGPDPRTAAVIATHPLTRSGALRVAETPVAGPPGLHRNAALALARAPHVVFTDDDCFPPPSWLEAVAEAVRANPEAIIQGPVLADPAEQAMLRSPFPHVQHFTDVPRVWAECANIAYPRAVLEAAGGLLEDVVSGEDTDLCLRVRSTGVAFVGAPAMATFHTVGDGTLGSQLRATRRWADLIQMLERHPELRVQLFAGVFWHAAHFWLLAGGAGCGLWAHNRRPALAAAALIPWVLCRPRRGGGWRGAARHVAELPGWALIDAAQIAVLARASARRGTLML